MPERQRLKNLDRLRARQDTILFTTDVCARGIDVPQVKLVIEMATPNSAATHIHRIGRCVRVEGGKEQRGLAISLVENSDKETFNNILRVCDYSKREAPKAMELDLELLESMENIVEYLIPAAEKEIEHTTFARKSAVFDGVEKMLDATLEGDILDAADLKRYHERFRKRVNKNGDNQREHLQEIFQEVGEEARKARDQLVVEIKRSLLRHVGARKSHEIGLLDTNPREIVIPEQYKLEENMIKSEITNDIKYFDRERGKLVAADVDIMRDEPAAKVVVPDSEHSGKEAKHATEKGNKQAGKAQKKNKLAKPEEEEEQRPEVITGHVTELTGEAEMPLARIIPRNKRRPKKPAKSNEREAAREGQEILGELKKSGMKDE